jgi:hypothetical protein
MFSKNKIYEILKKCFLVKIKLSTEKYIIVFEMWCTQGFASDSILCEG